MTVTLRLPTYDNRLETYRPGTARIFSALGPPRTRVAFAAAHVVADPLADNTPGTSARIDWTATLAYRHHLWEQGLGVAEAMDTAQRGMGTDWPTARELIRRCAAEAATAGGAVAAGVGTDHLPLQVNDLAAVIHAYEEQVAAVEDAGAQVILMASRQLARCARGREDYKHVYGRILEQVRRPVILHWLGPMFDPALAGYWGASRVEEATTTVLDLVRDFAHKIDGVKLSLLDPAHEVAFRRQLPSGVRLYTGDDLHYPELIQGDAHGHSDALLGIFDAIAPAASAALHALDVGDFTRYNAILSPTVPLARHIFTSPTYYYKTGIVFLAYLTGHQSHFRMVNGMESARSIPHLARLFILADQAGLFFDVDLATWRMRSILATAGIES